MTLNELQKRILREFFSLQCREESGSLIEDETPLVSYKRLEKELGKSRDRLRVELIELRDEGLVELSVAINQDYMPSGSGYMLTEKGVALANELFFSPTKS